MKERRTITQNDPNAKIIKISEIEILDNVRVDTKPETLVPLIENIRQHGLLESVGVGETKSGKYVLLYGHRRLMACQKLGWVTISAKVVEEPTREQFIIINMVENCQRLDPSPFEFGRQCHLLIKDEGYTVKEIAAVLNLPISRIESAIAAFKHVPDKHIDRVKFMGKGESRKGNIPASLSKKITDLQRRRSLSKKDIEMLFDETRTHNLTGEDMSVVCSLMHLGFTPKKAAKEVKKYKCCRVDVVVLRSEVTKRMAGTKMSLSKILTELVYGTEKPFSRPFFVDSSKETSARKKKV